MARYLARRLGSLVVTLVAASIVVFGVLQVLPGDPATVMLGTAATPEALAALRDQLGLNEPLWVRYGDWLHGMVTFDLGVSPVSGMDVGARLADAFQVTASLLLVAMVCAVAFALPLGVFAAVRRDRPSGAVVSVLSQVGVALPSFWVGVMLVGVFAVRLRWFPANGYVDPTDDVQQWFVRLLLPGVALALVQGSVLLRHTRSAMLDVLSQDYLRTARAAGQTRATALWRHGLRNAAVPVLTIMGVQVMTLLAGAVVVEQVFALPGLGSLLLAATGSRDLLVVQTAVFLMVALGLTVSFLVDLAHMSIDPRLRRGVEAR